MGHKALKKFKVKNMPYCFWNDAEKKTENDSSEI